MANEEHLKILKQGVDVWNKWREENPDIRPDLSGAVLTKADLTEINFYGAILRWANLKGIDLRSANFNRADLSEANLRETNLTQANLADAFLNSTDLSQAIIRGADLNRANLRGAKLKGAKLSTANLNCADLTKTNLIEANLNGAILTDANLSQTKAIEAELKGANLNRVDLTQADFSRAILTRAKLNETNLKDAMFSKANLIMSELKKANLRKADLSQSKLNKADLREASFIETDLTQSILIGVKMNGANLTGANFHGATLVGANLEKAILIGTKLDAANLTDCNIFGISAWDVEIDETTTKQSNLVITEKNTAVISVDNLEVAQFVYLLLNNKKIRDVIDTITSKVVLILGRFSEKRKPVLDQLREVLRKRGLAPILFDFDKPVSKDTTGTIETLARMARFIIADLTDPSSIPHELATIVPFMRTTPVVPIRLKGSVGYSMFDDFETAYNWVLPKYEYENDEILIESVSEKIIGPAVEKIKEIQGGL